MKQYNSIAEFNTAIENMRMQLPAVMLPLVKKAETDMCREIRARVSVTGETSTGGTFSAYSPKYAKKKSKYGLSALGKKTDKKNFYFTGAMWQSFGIKTISVQGTHIISNINFMGQSGYTKTEDLNEYHSDRESQGIAYPNKEEEEMLFAEIQKIVVLSLDQLL
jgi:hypothetical protein